MASEIPSAEERCSDSLLDSEGLMELFGLPLTLFRLANACRSKACGDEVTYVINRNINFTNVCLGRCRFCSFRDKERYTLTHEQILERVAEADIRGATEICLQGGLHPRMVLEDYCEILEVIHRDFPGMHLHAYSPMEVQHMSEGSRVPVREALAELKRSGLGSMPGTAAEILVDAVRERICPEKLSSDQWRRIIMTAHRMGIPSTSTILYGHVETLQDRLRHLEVLRDIQRLTHGFTELVLLPFIPERNELGSSVRRLGLLEHLKMHALARVALYPYITNIQASWVKLGREAAAAALEWGANDLGGTLMDEGIARSPDEGSSISPQELAALIEGRGRRAVQRTTLYERLFPG